jgi:hypothetical protein
MFSSEPLLVSASNSKFTQVTRIYDHFQDKVYLFIIYIYVTACLIATFNQPLWSN